MNCIRLVAVISSPCGTAQAAPNIAFIKYWGNRDNTLRLPMNGSISMNLDGLYTRTTVSFQHSLAFDELIINGHDLALVKILQSLSNHI
jgi:mevalonate pyrophosphate decarboxylase